MNVAWPARLSLAPDSLHLWITDTSTALTHKQACLLDADERIRWQRFHFEADRDQYLLAHVLLRSVLSLYLDTDPTGLTFGRGAKGKPHLPGCGIEFNLSHSGVYCLLGVCRGTQIGVDIERHRPSRGFAALAGRCFDDHERGVVARLSGDALTRYFYDCWALKESVIKACGRGLSMPLQRFGFRGPEGDDKLALCWQDELEESSKSWRTLLYQAPPGYSAAVSLLGPSSASCNAPDVYHCVPGIHYSEANILPTLDSGRSGPV